MEFNGIGCALKGIFHGILEKYHWELTGLTLWLFNMALDNGESIIYDDSRISEMVMFPIYLSLPQGTGVGKCPN